MERTPQVLSSTDESSEQILAVGLLYCVVITNKKLVQRNASICYSVFTKEKAKQGVTLRLGA